VGKVLVTFTLGNTLPSNGLIAVTFPEGFVLNSGPEEDQNTGTDTGLDGSIVFGAGGDSSSEPDAIVQVFGQTVVVFRSWSEASDIGGGTSVTLTLTNIKNPPVSGDTGVYEIRTSVIRNTQDPV
jgi:hypothetical protein